MQIYRRQIISIFLLGFLASFVTEANSQCEYEFHVIFDASENMRIHIENAKNFLMNYYSKLKQTADIPKSSMFFKSYGAVSINYFEDENQLKSIFDDFEFGFEFLMQLLIINIF